MTNTTTIAGTIGALNSQLDQLGLPLGYGNPPAGDGFWEIIWWWFGKVKDEFWGLAISAFAISLGAPFWFNLLSQVANLRNAGKAPPEATPTTTTPG